MRRPKLGRHHVLRTLAAITLAAAACAVNPATGERELMLISESREIEMGREYDQRIVEEMGLYPDRGLQTYVQELGERLAATSERPELPWTFRVVDDPVVNAFALPGGFIYITRGILAHLNSEAELAAVLGHEIGHVTARHSAHQMSQSMLAQIGLVGAAAAFPSVGQYAGLANAGLGLLFLKYGRDDERQADRLGLRYMHADGYDPTEMPDVFDMLARVSDASGAGRAPSWLSTHPAPEDRRERIADEIATLADSEDAGRTVGREDYLRRLERLVFGDDPRQGFFRESRFLHPEMRFQVAFPDGWKTQNTRQAVAAGSPEEDAVMQLSLADEAGAEAAAGSFVRNSGVNASEPVRRPVGAGDLPMVAFNFTATTQNGSEVAGGAAFIEYDGRVFRILGYAPHSRWSRYADTFGAAVESFGPLTDPDVLATEPWRLDIVRIDRATTLTAIAGDDMVPVSADTLALLNGVEPDEALPAGRQVKRVIGEPTT